MEVNRGDENAPLVDLCQQVRGEMESRRRRRHAPVMRSIDGLVALAISRRRRPADVWWQRHFAILRERGARIERADEADLSQTAAEHRYNLDCAILAKRDATAGLEFSSGVPHREPRAVGHLTD